MPKYVVSKRMREAAWQNTTVIGGDVVEVARSSRARRTGGDIDLHGSADLLEPADPARRRSTSTGRWCSPLTLGSGKPTVPRAH